LKASLFSILCEKGGKVPHIPGESQANDSPSRWTNWFIGGGIIFAVLVGLYLTTWVNYLLFHTLVEVFSIVVAFSLFLIAWNSRRYINNPYLLFIGIAYLSIGMLDMLHTLSYKGMPIFSDYDYYANQLWIAARYVESISLLLAFFFLYSDRSPSPGWTLSLYAIVTTVLIASIFHWKVFPVCFVEGEGLTPFKKTSEYVISAILLLDIYLLSANKRKFEHHVFWLLLWSLICTIISELAFTFYVSNYGFSNLVGHYFKLFSFFLIYEAIVRTGIKRPYELIFRSLAQSNRDMADEVAARRSTEVKLRRALDEIKGLHGILPICTHCKKIRDDKGAWKQLEEYIHTHSDAEFSHGLCPDCLERHYPDFR